MKVEIESPEEILEMLMAITRLDFDKKLKTTTGSSIENVISMGLNSLSDALKENVIDKQKYYESEQRFKALAKSVPGFFSYIDKDYTYQFINENYLTHFKVAEEEIIGRTMIELLGEEYFIKIKKHLDKALEGEVVKYNDTFTFKEKNIMHIHATYVPDFNSKNEVKGLYVLVQDTTILVESQKHRSIFENFFNNSPDIFTVASIKGDILLVNKSFESILGWTKDATSKKNFLDFVHPRDIKRTTQEFAKLEDKNHQTFGFENQYQTINGDWKWIRWNAINAQSKDVIYAIGTDITEQKNQDKKLDESYQTYMKLFKNASVGIILIEASSGVILTINQQGAGQLDYNTEELTGQNITKIIPESLYQHYQDVLTNETNLDIESIQLTKDGELIPVSVSATSVIIEETEVYQAFVKDIRSRRAMEAKLAQEKKISYQFQSRLLSSQLNPHFIFNVLNSFQFYLLEKNLEQSLEFVASFSTIMREVLENSTNISLIR